MLPDLSPTRAEVDLGAIRHNARVLARLAAPASVLAVVKADAYGHGAIPVARALAEEGVKRFAVATVGEGATLREAGIETPILVFAAPLPHALAAYVRLGLSVTVSSREVAEHVTEAARTHGPLTAHVKVDTGMRRLGVRPEETAEVLRLLHDAPGVSAEALWTHLATADGDLGFARDQLRTFETLLGDLGSLRPPLHHVANGPMLLRMPEDAAREGTLVRAGGVLYGLSSSRMLAPHLAAADLRPAMRLVTRVVHLQTVRAGETISYGRTWTAPEDRRIATLPVGYADGLPRALSNRGRVGIGGRLLPIAGRVCMDMLLADLGPPDGPAASVRLGDEAVLFGPGGPDALDQAEAGETITYELTCALAARVGRAWR
ncbi:MAG: alanine racemase [Bacteroidota bacterium]